MKTKNILLTIAGFTAGIILAGCSRTPSEQKVENAAENVQEAREDLTKAENKYAEEWGNFKNESKENLQKNENEIARLREQENSDAKFKKKYDQKITELEARNKEIDRKLKEYEQQDEETRKSKWEEFKKEFRHDMGELGQAFKDLTKDNVK